MSGSKVQPVNDLIPLRAQWALEGKRVVWTNGCFDILHKGHLQTLKFAKSKGDKLVVNLVDTKGDKRTDEATVS